MRATVRPTVDPDGWVSARPGARSWRRTAEGVVVRRQGSSTRLWRSSYKPELSSNVVAEHGQAIRDVARAWAQDPVLIVATVVAESANDPEASRNEPRVCDASYGLAQVLTGTAAFLARRIGWPLRSQVETGIAQPSLSGTVAVAYAMPDRPLPDGGDRGEWREFLEDPWVSLNLCAALHEYNDEQHRLDGDPVFLYASYNAGGPYAADNPWGLRAADAGLAIDTFVRHYGCACEAWARA